MSLTTSNFIPGNTGTQNRTLGKRVGLPGQQGPEISGTISPAPGTDGKRDHVADVSDPDSPLYNESDPEFDPNWDREEDSFMSQTDFASRDDSTGTGGIAGVPLTGVAPIGHARCVADSILKGKK
jgi:hypothetical protein